MNWYKRAKIEVRIRQELTGAHHGQVDMTAIAYADTEPVGFAQYAVFENKVHIQYIHVKEGLRREGIGTQLIEDIKREYPAMNINWGMTMPEGSAFQEKVA